MVRVMQLTSNLKRYIEEHTTTLRLAEAFLRNAQAKGKPTCLGDVAFHVASQTKYGVMEWQATAIVSHALKRGAFGPARAVRGIGIVFGKQKLHLVAPPAKGSKKRAA